MYFNFMCFCQTLGIKALPLKCEYNLATSFEGKSLCPSIQSLANTTFIKLLFKTLILKKRGFIHMGFVSAHSYVFPVRRRMEF